MKEISQPQTGIQSADRYRFVITGAAMTSLRKKLKPALPKKKQEPYSIVVIRSAVSEVTFAIAGASITTPSQTNGPFVAEIPYLMFKNFLTAVYQDDAFVVFELSAGSFAVDGIATKSSEVIVQAAADGPPITQLPAPEAQAIEVTPTPSTADSPPMIADPLSAPMGLPLVGAYKYIRKYGIQPWVVSRTFAKQQVEVDNLLDKAVRLLQPVGLSRADLERLLDAKFGTE